MGRICCICKKIGLIKLPKAHEERLLKELGFSGSNLPPKNAFFCREHFTEDSFKCFDCRTVWNYNPRVKVLSNDSGSPGNTLGEAGAYEVEILEEYDDESFAGSSVPPSLTNNLNQALGTASEEAGFTGFEIPNECDDESFAGVSVPSVNKSLKNDHSQALEDASEEAGYTGFEILEDYDDESFAGVSTSNVNESQQNIKWSRGSSWECIVGISSSIYENSEWKISEDQQSQESSCSFDVESPKQYEA